MLAAAALALPARAVKLSLEENRVERGGVGFVDMQRLFLNSPDAARAKDSFAALSREAEERLNLKKAELLRRRRELASLEAEREALAKAAETPAVPASPAAASVSSAAPASVAVATGTPALPGMSPRAQAPAAAPADAASAVPAESAARGASRRILELDGRIAGLRAEIERTDAETQREQSDADKGLLEVEGRKVDQVLARLYRAISETARQEGVSVVVDKSAVIYGYPGLDLTDRVLKRLGSNGAAQP